MTVMRRAARDPFADLEALIASVYGYVVYRIGHGPDAEDATSETFARALRYRDSYDPARGTPTGWLIGIARRCVDELRRAPRPHAAVAERAADGDLESATVERLRMSAALQQLGERDRELIALRYGADMSPRQIGQRLALSPNAVDVALHRARARLRQLLAGTDTCEEVVELDADGVRISVAPR